MTKIIILDDETHCTDILSALISKIPADYQLIGVFNEPQKALNFIQENEIDLLFLDIEMPGMNGFTFLDKVLPVKFDIIFTTAYDQYAIRAFDYSAINYLLKPITEKAIVKTLASWERRKNKTNSAQWDMLQKIINKADTPQTQIALPTGVGYEIIKIETIVRCKSENNYTYFFFENGNKMLVSRTLKDVETMLTDHRFFRVHQSHLINPKFVKTVSKQEGGILHMTDGSEIPVSRQKRSCIGEILNTMLRFE